jgi:hypothetical protein
LLRVIPKEAAVDDDGGAGDVVGVAGGEEGGGAGDVGGFAEAVQRDVVQQGLHEVGAVEQLGVDRGFDGAGGDVIDRNAEGSQFDGEVSAEHLERSLAGAIAREVGEGEFFVNGANVDDLAGTFGLAQVIHEILSEEESALEVDIEHEVVVAFGDVPKVRVFFDASVVHEDVDLAEIGYSFGDETAIVREIGKITADDTGAATEGLHFLPGLGSAGIAETVVDDDIRAFLSQPDGDGLSDSLGAAGDEGYFSLEFHRYNLFALESVKLADHLTDESRPAGLMAGTDAGSIVAIEVFVEEQVIAPVGIILEELDVSIEGASSVFIAPENANEAFFQFE